MARTLPDLSMSQRSCTNDVFYNTQSQTSLHHQIGWTLQKVLCFLSQPKRILIGVHSFHKNLQMFSISCLVVGSRLKCLTPSYSSQDKK